jgi:hypothetical protein
MFLVVNKIEEQDIFLEKNAKLVKTKFHKRQKAETNHIFVQIGLGLS